MNKRRQVLDVNQEPMPAADSPSLPEAAGLVHRAQLLRRHLHAY